MKITELDPTDYDAHVRQAEILMVRAVRCHLFVCIRPCTLFVLVAQAMPGRTSAVQANKSFDRAVKAYRHHSRYSPYQLWSNWGVVVHRCLQAPKAGGRRLRDT